MKFKHLLGGMVLAATFSSLALADSIGIHIVGLKPDSQTLEPADSAGVSAVAQGHWNNITVSNDDPNGHNNEGKLATLQNAGGKEVKGASVQIDAAPSCQVFPVNGSPWGFTGANLTLQSGEASPQARVTVKNIPYKHYAVYVYLTAGDNGGQGSATISTSDPKGKVDPAKTYFYNYNWQNGLYAKSDAKSLKDAKDSSGSNYILFTDNTARDFTVECDGKLGGGWTGLAAVQIVELP